MTEKGPYRSDEAKKIAELELECDRLRDEHKRAVEANQTWRRRYSELTEWELVLSGVLGISVAASFAVFFSYLVLDWWASRGASRSFVAVVLGILWTIGGVFVGIAGANALMRRYKLWVEPGKEKK